MNTALPAVLVEAFAADPCSGNGAAVVLLDEPLGDGWLQAIARSLNQSETAFLLQQRRKWCLRWFTPTCEVPLCGHATLAALFALGHWGHLQPGQRCHLLSRSGPLEVVHGPSACTGQIVLPSGSLKPAAPSCNLVALLRAHLGVKPEAYWNSDLGYRVALLPSGSPLALMRDLAEHLDPQDRGGLVLMLDFDATPRGLRPTVLDRPADYQIRFFAPGLGISEDAVTGSAHALVAPFWQERLGRDTVVGWQCSQRPGGMICELACSGMIRLSGTGHLLWNGTLYGRSDGSGAGSWSSLLDAA